MVNCIISVFMFFYRFFFSVINTSSLSLICIFIVITLELYLNYPVYQYISILKNCLKSIKLKISYKIKNLYRQELYLFVNLHRTNNKIFSHYYLDYFPLNVSSKFKNEFIFLSVH